MHSIIYLCKVTAPEMYDSGCILDFILNIMDGTMSVPVLHQSPLKSQLNVHKEWCQCHEQKNENN